MLKLDYTRGGRKKPTPFPRTMWPRARAGGSGLGPRALLPIYIIYRHWCWGGPPSKIVQTSRVPILVPRLVPTQNTQNNFYKKSDPIESQRKNLSGSWHSGRSQHEQYLGHAGSSVQDLPHRRHSKIVTPEPLQWGSRGLQASKTSMRSFVSRYVQRHSTPAEIPT